MARITRLLIGGQAAAWSSIGLSFPGGICSLGDVALRLDSTLPSGLHSFDISGCVASGDIDGIPVTCVDSSPIHAARIDSSVIDVVGIDHVVVMTNDLERTSADVVRVIGEPLKRIREAGPGTRQGFHRLGSVVLEIVEQATVVKTALWGFVLTVNNIDEVAAHMGPDVISAPKDAVQPGRRIATFRSGVGLGVAVALITPETTRQ